MAADHDGNEWKSLLIIVRSGPCDRCLATVDVGKSLAACGKAEKV